MSAVCEADFECEHTAQVSGHDALIRGYFDNPHAFRAQISAVRLQRRGSKTARAEIAPPRETEKLIPNVGDDINSMSFTTLLSAQIAEW